MRVDWSKAPEDATHAHAVSGRFLRWIVGHWWIWTIRDCGDPFWACTEWPSVNPEHIIPRPKPQSSEWDGGLPPVGCECEMLHPGIEAYGWQKVIIKAHFDDRVAIKGSEYIWDNSGYAAIKVDDELQFRPIRTQAEREREELTKVIEREGVTDEVDAFQLALAILSRYELKERNP